MVDIPGIQKALAASEADAWLFVDHHGRDEIASLVLGPELARALTRRWYYLIPRQGEPRKVVHRIEAGKLATLPGSQTEYALWEEQRRAVIGLCRDYRRIAMQYSPEGMLLLVSNVDGGVIDLVRASGSEVVSSAELIQRLFSLLTTEQRALHREAARLVDAILQRAFERVRSASGRIREAELKGFILGQFAEHNLVTEHGPVVATEQNTASPHYEPASGSDRIIRPGELVLIDLWAKLRAPQAPYYDITWVACCGAPRNPDCLKVFEVVRSARDEAVQLVRASAKQKARLSGCEVDAAARGVITAAGYGPHFSHRTGHSITTSVHGMGVNIDGYETLDTRPLLAGSCFSIEPGIYLGEFGIRSELNMLVEEETAEVTGAIQTELLIL